MKSTGRSQRAVATALAITACCGLAACGGASKHSSSTSTATAAKLSTAAVNTFLGYTGGHAGAANPKLSPIGLGFVNSVGGITSLPWYNTEVQHAVSTVNSQLGGVDGHPLKLTICNAASSAEQGQACAEQFLADPTMKVVMTAGLDDPMDAALHKTLAGKLPVIGSQPATLADANYKNSFYLTSGVFGATGMITYLRDYLHAHTVSMLSANDVPVAVQAAGIIKSYLQAYGIKVKQGTFSAEATDYLPAIEAANAQTSDAVLALVILPDQCLGMARSLQQAAVSKPVISFYSCVTTTVKDALGDYPKWTYFSFIPNVLGPPANAAQAAQFSAFDQWVAPFLSELPDAGDAANNLSTVLTIVKILDQLQPKPLTASAISSKMLAFQGPVLLGAPKLAFHGVAVFNQVGTLGSTFPTYAGHGHWTDPTHGVWLVPPNIASGIYN